MALVICPECNESISSEAETCPHCGLPLKTKDAKARYGSHGWGTFIYLVIAFAGLTMLVQGSLIIGIILLLIGIFLLIGRMMLWSKTGKKIR